MRHVASGETQRQCSTKESAHTAPAKHQAYELPMNSKLVARKGGIGADCCRCCDASRVDRDDAHAFTNYASPSLAEIGALAEQRGRSAAEPIYPSVQLPIAVWSGFVAVPRYTWLYFLFFNSI
jgi:hypothetical protein